MHFMQVCTVHMYVRMYVCKYSTHKCMYIQYVQYVCMYACTVCTVHMYTCTVCTVHMYVHTVCTVHMYTCTVCTVRTYVCMLVQIVHVRNLHTRGREVQDTHRFLLLRSVGRLFRTRFNYHLLPMVTVYTANTIQDVCILYRMYVSCTGCMCLVQDVCV